MVFKKTNFFKIASLDRRSLYLPYLLPLKNKIFLTFAKGQKMQTVPQLYLKYSHDHQKH